MYNFHISVLSFTKIQYGDRRPFCFELQSIHRLTAIISFRNKTENPPDMPKRLLSFPQFSKNKQLTKNTRSLEWNDDWIVL